MQRTIARPVVGALAALALLGTTACSNMTNREERTLSGAGLGAAGGAVVGFLAGSTLIGLLVGGAAGAAIGALTTDDQVRVKP
ncbi:MAG: hypothetical protein FJX53_07850 [Alphaproteobacteria bacterium]|nr:hypothetical protein [Alphaproteobacteria bacterium]